MMLAVTGLRCYSVLVGAEGEEASERPEEGDKWMWAGDVGLEMEGSCKEEMQPQRYRHRMWEEDVKARTAFVRPHLSSSSRSECREPFP